MDIRLLGPVELRRADRPVAIHGRAARAVLAMLALERGRLLSVDDLVEGLWGEGLPADPTAALYVAVSRVRVALGPDRGRLRTADHGYVLDVDDAEVDAGRAAAALARGSALLDDHPAAARVLLVAGLGEWRHETPLVELADLPFAPVAASRLQQLRSELVEKANQACLECGHPREVIERSERALRLDPWREHLVAQLMTAFHQMGRQGDALAAYVRLASDLKADFGAEPSLEVKELRARILQPAAVGPANASDQPHASDGGADQSLPVWFKTALEDLDPAGRDDRLRCRLMLALGQAEHHAGLPTWPETLLKAAEMALDIGDPSLVAQAVLGGALGWTVTPGQPDTRRAELMKFALEHGEELDDDVLVRLVGAYADDLAFTTALEERMQLTDQAVRRARLCGRPALLLQALNHRFNAIWAPQTLPTRRRDAAEACRLAQGRGDLRDSIVAHGFAMAAAVEAADIDEADRHLDAFGALADELGLPVFQWGARTHRVWRAIIAGDLDQAEVALEQAWQFGVSHGRPEADLVHVTQRAALRWIQGRLSEETEALTGLAEALPALPALEALRALAALHAGQVEEASRLLHQAWHSGAIAHFPADQNYLAGLAHWSEIAAATGQTQAATELYSLLAPYTGRLVYTGTAIYGPVAYPLGLLAQVLGHRQQAQAHLLDAEQTATRIRSTSLAARAARELERLRATIPSVFEQQP